MRVMDLTERIEKEIPREQALDWDNVGLLVGDKEQEIHKGYVALDLTDAVLEHAIDCGADMILTHHPLIFGGIKRVNADDFYRQADPGTGTARHCLLCHAYQF